jgi:hypothetical protein
MNKVSSRLPRVPTTPVVIIMQKSERFAMEVTMMDKPKAIKFLKKNREYSYLGTEMGNDMYGIAGETE